MLQSQVDQNIDYFFDRLHEKVHTSLWMYILTVNDPTLHMPDDCIAHIPNLSEIEYERMCYHVAYDIFYLAPIAAPTMTHDYIQLARKSGRWVNPTPDDIKKYVMKPGMDIDETFQFILENVDLSLKKAKRGK